MEAKVEATERKRHEGFGVQYRFKIIILSTSPEKQCVDIAYYCIIVIHVCYS